MQDQKTTAYVYIAKIPQSVSVAPVFPPSREREIAACKNMRVRTEKYCVWKLLEYALEHGVGLQLKNLHFSKTEHGKWQAEECCFSLSHSGEWAAVAVSKCAVGVDVEKSSPKLLSARRKFLTERESEAWQALSTEEAKTEFLLEKWTQKESIFKAYGEGGFAPARISADDYPTRTFVLENGYVLSVATSAEEIVCRDCGDRE